MLLIIWVAAININQGANAAQVLMSILFVMVLFVCVTLHELGHSLAARRYGIDTKGITLLPIGGMANIEGMPEKPKQEVVVTLAGLIVNVIIAAVLWVVIKLIPGYGFDTDFQAINSKNFLILLMYTNLLIVAFNLIPAFPMDGGRILRALLALKYKRVKATKYSMMAGQVFGAFFALAGLFINPFLFVIGVFVFIGARSEYMQVKFSSLLTDYQAKDIVMDDYTVLKPDDPLQKAVDIMLKTRQRGFLISSEEDDDIMGILTRDNLINGLANHNNDEDVSLVMTTDFKKVEAGTSLQKVFQIMQQGKLDLLPVFENDKLFGVIDQENIQEFISVQTALHKD